jgi:butyryl-CoA dehydrogenase
MFLMMNEARVGVGSCAAALGTAGYYHSLEYAVQRLQGRLITAKDPASPQVQRCL